MTRLAVLLGAALCFLAGLALGVAKPCPEPHERADFSPEGEAKWRAEWDDWATDALTEALAKGGS